MADEAELLRIEPVSFQAAFASFLTNEKLHDITLKGIDGVLVGANKFALAARSDVFEKMLLGGFNESSKSELELGFDGIVLKAVVEFICTDTTKVLKCFNQTDTNLSTPEDFQHANTLLSLMGAASYFNLPGLFQKAHSYASASLANMPSLAFPILEACHQQEPLLPKELQRLALSSIHSSDIFIENPIALALVSSASLAVILQDEDTVLEEFELFQIVKYWAEADSSLIKSGKQQGRKSAASELMKHIHLEMIDPQTLSTIVASSGLVTNEQLLNAYKSQALSAQKQYGSPPFKKCRSTAVWKYCKSEVYTGSHDYDKINCKPMQSGIHQWTLEVQETSDINSCGVMLSTAPQDHSISIIENEKTWWYEGDGERYQCGTEIEEIELRFKKGSKVMFTLDLSPEEENNGTLSVSVDAGYVVTLFTGLRAPLDGTTGGFLPVVSCSDGAQIKIIKFEKL